MMEHICISKAYKELVLRKKRRNVIERYKGKLELLERYLISEYEKIDIYFGKYTKHDWVHTIKVLDYMYELVYNPHYLSEEELMLMIYVALLHDIGMGVTGEEVKQFIPFSQLDSWICRYKKTHADCGNENASGACITDLLRAKHGEIAAIKIKGIPDIGKPESFQALFQLCPGSSSVENWDLTDIVATICHSHVKPVSWIQEVLYDNTMAQYMACLLRIADLLDLDGSRADAFHQYSWGVADINGIYYTLNQVFGDSAKVKDCQQKNCEKICPKRRKNEPCKKYQKIELVITLPPNLNHSTAIRIWSMINDYKDELTDEIRAVQNLLSGVEEKYHIRLANDIVCTTMKTQTANSPKLDTQKLSIDYSAIKTFFSGDQLYTDRIFGIREIVQNAYDACKAFAELNHNEISWSAQIIVVYDSKENTLNICDNGIGMTDFVIKEYLLSIGKSIYNCEPSYLYDNYHRDHIGHFGLGIFASFMLSPCITIISQSYSSEKAIMIELDKNSSYATLTYNYHTVIGHGTQVILNFRDIQTALGIDDAAGCLELLAEYISEAFLSDGIEISFIIDGAAKESIDLCMLPIPKWDVLDEFFIGITASAHISEKIFPPIFYAESSKEIVHVEYDELLQHLKQHYGRNCKVPYLDAGSFIIFPGNPAVEKDFSDKADSLNPRRNYSSITPISDGIPGNIRDFIKSNHLDVTTHCDYAFLNLIVDGNNAALCDENVLCSGLGAVMKRNDACGEAPKEDKIFLRDVLLPRVHVALPIINFRYIFDGLILNIKTDEVFPTLTRDTLTNEKIKELSIAVGGAIAQCKAASGLNAFENSMITKTFYNDICIVNNIFIHRSV